MTTESTIGSELRSTSNDACVLALEKNWTAIIGSASGEIAQWSFDFFLSWFSPVIWFLDFLGWIPFVGGAL